MTNIYHFFFWQAVCAGLAHPLLIFISSSLYFLLLFYRYLFTYLVARTSATPEMELTILISHLGRAFLLCGDSQNVRTPTPFSFFCALLSVRQRRFRNAKDTNTFSLCVFVQPVSPSRQCNYTLPSHPTLLFPFRA